MVKPYLTVDEDARLDSEFITAWFVAVQRFIARQIHFTPHAARLTGAPKEQNMQALAKWLKVEPRWLRYGGYVAQWRFN